MFSIDNFYFILYENLLKQADVQLHYYYPFGSTDANDIIEYPEHSSVWKNHMLIHDQEPIINSLPVLPNEITKFNQCKILANSEHSSYKTEQCRQNNWEDFYYFFHGFAALYWYNDWKYFSTVERNFTHPFINLNRLVSNDRSYRLLLVTKMIEQDLHKKGLVSLSLMDHGYGNYRNELSSSNSKLSGTQKYFIDTQLAKIDYKSLIVDTEEPEGNLSASAGIQYFNLNQKALWNIVSETVFYHNKLHLTEKIFKPIACRRPFILVAAPGNLAYLKSYGFKSFDRWIDESYDQEYDHDKRLEKIVIEIRKISSLNTSELKIMHNEMQDVLQHNYRHFYGNFKQILIKELIDNFKNLLINWNDKTDNKNLLIDLKRIDFAKAFDALMV